METLFRFVYCAAHIFPYGVVLDFNLNLRGTLFHACENPPLRSVRFCPFLLPPFLSVTILSKLPYKRIKIVS